jgi:hypothetical protein
MNVQIDHGRKVNELMNLVKGPIIALESTWCHSPLPKRPSFMKREAYLVSDQAHRRDKRREGRAERRTDRQACPTPRNIGLQDLVSSLEVLHHGTTGAGQIVEIRHVTRQAVARSDKSFERVLRNLEFLQINAQSLFKFLDRGVELVDPSLFNLVALRNVSPNRGDGGICSQNLVIGVHANCPHIGYPTPRFSGERLHASSDSNDH